MKVLKKIAFVSDVHLQENEPQTTQEFLHFLESQKPTLQALYILGDLFEAWIGDDEISKLHQTIIQAFHQLTEAKIPIYFIHGNRDFHIGKQFLQATGIKLLNDHEKISVFGHDVLIMHGDTLCTEDHAYHRARKILRHPWIKKLFLSFPLFLRKKIANKIRQKSKQYTSETPQEIMDVSQTTVEQMMQNHGVSILIHGHTHRPGRHSFQLNQQTVERIVLGSWHNQISFFEWDELGNKNLITKGSGLTS